MQRESCLKLGSKQQHKVYWCSFHIGLNKYKHSWDYACFKQNIFFVSKILDMLSTKFDVKCVKKKVCLFAIRNHKVTKNVKTLIILDKSWVSTIKKKC